MKEEDILRKKLGKINSFQVPDGYFDQLTSEVMKQLPEKDIHAFEEAPVSLWVKVKPLLYMAAMFVGAALIIRVATGSPESASTPAIAQTVEEQEVLSEEMIDMALNRVMFDDYSLYVYLSDSANE